MPNLKAFGKIGLRVAGIMVPQIAAVEAAAMEIRSGRDKKAAVLQTVAASLDLSEALSGQEICDQTLLAEGLSQINDGFVKVMKSLEPQNDPR
jgi:hypothetical protein